MVVRIGQFKPAEMLAEMLNKCQGVRISQFKPKQMAEMLHSCQGKKAYRDCGSDV